MAVKTKYKMTLEYISTLSGDILHTNSHIYETKELAEERAKFWEEKISNYRATVEPVEVEEWKVSH